jgi:hypothetical protein
MKYIMKYNIAEGQEVSPATQEILDKQTEAIDFISETLL